MATLYLILAIVSGLMTLTALVRLRRPSPLNIVHFLSGWLTGEMALLHLFAQLFITVLYGFAEGLYHSRAQLGLGIFALSWLGLLYLHIQATNASVHLKAALRKALGAHYLSEVTEQRRALLSDVIHSHSWLRPFRFKREGVRRVKDIAYAEEGGKRNLLDIYQPTVNSSELGPVLLQVHGGGWTIGNKEEQAKPLMYHLAQRGWVCVSINYRLSPRAQHPEHIIDVKKAIAWVKKNIADYGGNPEFIAITGGSAGGHLSSLAALTPNRAEWQPGFEDQDTTVQAAVPFYGVYDFLNRDGVRVSDDVEKFLAKRVMPQSKAAATELWDMASPISHVHADAPPTFVIHGSHDSLVWVEEARAFVAALQAESNAPVVYAELPGTQHAFEFFHSVRADHTVNAVTEFFGVLLRPLVESQKLNPLEGHITPAGLQKRQNS